MKNIYTNFWITWQHIQMQWSYFTLQTWFYALTLVHHILLNQKHAVALQDIFISEYTFKMCVGAPKGPNTCKLQHFKCFCRFCGRSINWGMFSDRKRCHNYRKQIIINRPPTSHYISMYGQYDNLWNWKLYNQATSITRNEYAIFLHSRPKDLKKVLHCMEISTGKPCWLFYEASLCKILSMCMSYISTEI